MSEDIVGQIKDIKGRTWQEAFYIQTKAFLEKNSEHIKEIARLKAEVERLTKAGDEFSDAMDKLAIFSSQDTWLMARMASLAFKDARNAAKEGKQP